MNIEEIRKRIIEAIKQSGLTQTELAKRIGVIQPSVNQYLSGRALPALDTFAKLCYVLDLDANEILGIKSDNVKPTAEVFEYSDGTHSVRHKKG